MRTELFDFSLPSDLIAQRPLPGREDAKLLVFSRPTLAHSHQRIADLPEFLTQNDLVVVNNSKVIPARLRGTRESGGQFEILLLEEAALNQWWAMLKPGRRTPVGSELRFHKHDGSASLVTARVLEKNEEGHCRLQFSGVANILDELEALGEVPLPPYIERPPHSVDPLDLERYQTVYALAPGSVAAPTAGLHFSKELLERVPHTEVTLHVGLGTFAPVKVENVEEHRMHEERYEISPAAARAIEETRKAGGRIVAAGTTSLRVLESVAAAHGGEIVPGRGGTSIFIHPPHNFLCVDALLTNFHLPKSTLLMLVAAFAAPRSTEGIERIQALYREAIQRRYRFFSYGDAMLIL